MLAGEGTVPSARTAVWAVCQCTSRGAGAAPGAGRLLCCYLVRGRSYSHGRFSQCLLLVCLWVPPRGCGSPFALLPMGTVQPSQLLFVSALTGVVGGVARGLFPMFRLSPCLRRCCETGRGPGTHPCPFPGCQAGRVTVSALFPPPWAVHLHP